jgi:hypothetical protein
LKFCNAAYCLELSRTQCWQARLARLRLGAMTPGNRE